MARNSWIAAAVILSLAVAAAAHAEPTVSAAPDAAPQPMPSAPDGPTAVIPEPGKGVLYVYRPNRLRGVFQGFPVSVDGKKIGSLANNTYIAIQLEPGIHVVDIPGKNNILFGSFPAVPADVNIEAGGTHYVRAVIGMSEKIYPSEAEVKFQGLEPADALAEMKSMQPASKR